MYKVTYIDKQDKSLVKTMEFPTLHEAIVFTNKQPMINQVLELKLYDDNPVKKENRT